MMLPIYVRADIGKHLCTNSVIQNYDGVDIL